MHFFKYYILGRTSPKNGTPEYKDKEMKTDGPKLFYFGMTLSHKGSSTSKNNTKPEEANHADSERSAEMKHNNDCSDVELKNRKPTKAEEPHRFVYLP